ncbi:hypothetical protein [Salinigranum salinum]|uniref:hypothetical protein n=1 Tax=Salinigranum salinum TaxID=1364937 RepID=UPI0012612513|nr:hypothetical protein [Salinigranum salinum]
MRAREDEVDASVVDVPLNLPNWFAPGETADDLHVRRGHPPTDRIEHLSSIVEIVEQVLDVVV